MEQAKHIMLYDSDCPMCTFQMLSIQALDWLKKVDLVPIKDDRTKTIAPDITRSDLLEAIHCVTPEGEVHRGARAIRFLGFRIPLLFPVGIFLWIPGVIYLAEIFYKFVADRRHVISKVFGCKGACTIFPDQD